MHDAKRTSHSLRRSSCIILVALCITGCSLPSLETAECSAGREVARQYYSLAIGGDLQRPPEAVERLNGLRSPRFTAGTLTGNAERDPFHFSMIQPTSYRVGECALLPDGPVRTEVTVIWRLDNENYLRRDDLIIAASGDRWLIERIDVGKQPGPDF